MQIIKNESLQPFFFFPWGNKLLKKLVKETRFPLTQIVCKAFSNHQTITNINSFSKKICLTHNISSIDWQAF